MIHVEIWPAAQNDLVEIQKIDKVAARRLYAVIEQMGADARLQDILLTHAAMSEESTIEVKKWLEQYNRGKNLWRLKVWPFVDEKYPLPYRIIYAFRPRDAQTRSPPILVVLGAVRKGEFNYGSTTPIEQRILIDYTRALEIL